MGAPDTEQVVSGGVVEIRPRLGIGQQEVAVIADRFTALNRLADAIAAVYFFQNAECPLARPTQVLSFSHLNFVAADTLSKSVVFLFAVCGFTIRIKLSLL